MGLKRFCFLVLIFLSVNKLWGQETSAVTETQPMVLNGLEIGYQVKSKEVRKVEDKGEFNRYAVKFYVTNKRSEPKIIFFNEDAGESSTVSDELAQFHCLNATGAMFTSKAATILADPCVVTGLVDIKDCGTDKPAQVKKSTQIGYWIKPGQTISTDEILIVPVNEAPKIQAYYMVGAKQNDNSSAGSTAGGGSSTAGPTVNMQDYLKIKNAGNSTYINIQTGGPSSSVIQKGWFSAQWLFVPVPGTSYYNIRNKWHQNFLDVDKNNLATSF